MVWYIVIFLAIVVSGPVILVIMNGRFHGQQRQLAAQQGWEYQPAGPLAGLRQTFKVSGTTAQDMAWTLTHDSSRQFIIWQSQAKTLPYGKLMVMPRFSQDTDQLLKQHQLRPVNFGSPEWRERYSLLNTHDQLTEKYFNDDVELTLLNWPERELPGGLMILIWDDQHLEIKARFDRDWNSFDRLISLGTTLLRTN